MISVFDLFKIGIGPSSSHTVGPMKAARLFAEGLFADGTASASPRCASSCFGSLGVTGRGHGTDRAVILGLLGETPDHVDADRIGALVGAVREAGRLSLLGRREVACEPRAAQLLFLRQRLPLHSNGMRFTALGSAGEPLRTRVYYSVGGGFVVDDAAAEPPPADGRRPARRCRTRSHRGRPARGCARPTASG